MAKMEPLSEIISSDPKDDSDKLNSGELCNASLPSVVTSNPLPLPPPPPPATQSSTPTSTGAPTSAPASMNGSSVSNNSISNNNSLAVNQNSNPNLIANNNNAGNTGSGGSSGGSNITSNNPSSGLLSGNEVELNANSSASVTNASDLKLTDELVSLATSDDLLKSHMDSGDTFSLSPNGPSLSNVKSEFGKLTNQLSEVTVKSEGHSPGNGSGGVLLPVLNSKSCPNNNIISNVNSGGACTPNGSANSNNLNNQSNNNVVIPTSSSNTINSLPPNTNNNNNTNNGLIQSGPQVNGSLQMVCTNPPTSSNGPMLPMSGNPPGIVPGSMSMMNCGPPTPLMSAQPNANILSDRNTPINSASAPNPNHHMQPQNQNIGKAPMDSQYMQQQSQICVFTTTLANEAAEAIQSKRFDSIITYHLSQLSTQKFLEKNPFKGQYRPNSASNWQAMNQQMQINSAMSQSNNNTANNSNKRIKQSASPQQMNAPLSNNNPGNGSSGNNSNSPYTYRPPSNSSVISNNSGNFRPGPSPGTPNDIGNWSTGAGETSGWNSPQQQQQPQQMPGNNFGLMQNPNQRMMPNAPTMTGPNRGWQPDSQCGPIGAQFAEPDQTNGPGPNSSMNGPGTHQLPPTSTASSNTSTGNSGTGRRRKHNQNQANAQNGHAANGTSNGPGSYCSPASQTSSALNSPSPGRLAGQMNSMSQQTMQQQQQHPPPPYSPATSSVGSMRLPPYASPGPPTPSSMDNQMMMNNMAPGAGSNLPMSGNSPKCVPNNNTTNNSMASQANMNMINMNGPSSAPSPSSPAAKKKHLSSGNGCSMLDMNSMESGFMSPGPLSTSQPNQGQPTRSNELQLMPVPSPTQIHYLHQFDDQELTIKRQRNLSARDADLISPELDYLPDFSSNSGGGPLCNSVGSNNGNPNAPPTGHNMPNTQQPQQMNRFTPQIDTNCNSPMMGSGGPNARFATPQPPYQDNRMNPNFTLSGPAPPGQAGMYGPGRPTSAGQPSMQSFGNNVPNSGVNPNQMLPNSMMTNDPNPMASIPLQPPLNEPPIGSNHLQNLQKMTLPFEIGHPAKMNDSFSSAPPIPPMSHPSGPPMNQQQMNNAFEMHTSGAGPGPNNGPQIMHPQEMQMPNCASVNCPPMNCPPGNGPPAGMAMMQPPMSQPGGHPYPNSSMSPMGHCGQPANGFSCPPNLMGSQNGPMLPPSPANQPQSMLPNGGRSPGPLYSSANTGFPHSASPKLTCSPSPQQMMMAPNGSHPNRPMPPYAPGVSAHQIQNRPPFGPRGPGCPPQAQMNPNVPPGTHLPPNAMMHVQPQVQRPGQFNQPNIQMNNAKPNTIQYMPNRPPNAMCSNSGPNNSMINPNRLPMLDFTPRYPSPPMGQMDQQQKGGLPPPMSYGAGPNNGGGGPGMPPGMSQNQGPPMHMNQMQMNGPPNQGQPGIMQMNVRPPHMMQMDGFGNPNRGPPPPGVQMPPVNCGPPLPGANPMMVKQMSGSPNDMAFMNAGVGGNSGNNGPPPPPPGSAPMGLGTPNGPMNPGGQPQFQGGPPMQGGGSMPGLPPAGSGGHKPFYPPMNANQDPEYAATYQNFQQQLYATNTRQPQNQMGGPMNQMPMNQMSNNPINQNGPFFGQQPKQ